MHACMYAWNGDHCEVYMYVRMYVRMYIWNEDWFTEVFMRMYACMQACTFGTRICVKYVCMYVCMNIWNEEWRDVCATKYHLVYISAHAYISIICIGAYMRVPQLYSMCIILNAFASIHMRTH
jgi:hypothetical protein